MKIIPDWDNDTEEETKEPLPKMARELTLRGLFAKDAPDVPAWYSNQYTRGKGMSIDEYVNAIGMNTLPLVSIDTYEEIYFQWRFYYADKMIELLNVKNK